jgi:hypothetical protein
MNFSPSVTYVAAFPKYSLAPEFLYTSPWQSRGKISQIISAYHPNSVAAFNPLSRETHCETIHQVKKLLEGQSPAAIDGSKPTRINPAFLLATS